MSDTQRVLVIGLDGATLDLIEPWVQTGHLPVMAGLMKAGGYGRLRSVIPVVSAGAWATFMTGVNPGKHGIFDFVYRDRTGYQLRPVTRMHISRPSLWQLLSEQDRRVGVVNVPMTYPPEPVNGFMVSGLGTPIYKDFTYPPELGERLVKEGYRVNRKMYYPENDEEGFLVDTFDLIDHITTSTLSLMTEREWDFFMVVYRDTDEVCHGFWRYMDPSHPDYDPTSAYKDAILELYKKLDTYTGKLVEAAGPDTTVFIVSDHGFGPLYKDVYLNEWLRNQGYLVTRTVPAQRHLLSRFGVTRDNISRFLRKAHLGRVERLIKDMLGDRIDLLPRAQWPEFSEGIDWSRTRAYSFGYQGQIYINLVGREPQGIVQPGADYYSLRDGVIQALKGLVDPEDGKPVVDRVYLKEDLYHGPELDRAPDIVISMRNLAYSTRLGYELGSRTGEIFSETRVHSSGGHRLEGVLIAAGPGISPAHEERTETWLGDIAPTVLHLMDCAIPAWMDGQVLREWLSPIYANRPTSTYQDTSHISEVNRSGMTANEEKEIMERLKDLGYLG